MQNVQMLVFAIEDQERVVASTGLLEVLAKEVRKHKQTQSFFHFKLFIFSFSANNVGCRYCCRFLKTYVPMIVQDTERARR